MSFGVPLPGSIEGLQDLETILEKGEPRILEMLLECREAEGGKLGSSIEFDERVPSYARFLAEMIGKAIDDEAEECEHIERSLHGIRIGHTVATAILKPTVFTPSFASLLECGQDPMQIFTYMADAPDEYLSHRPKLGELTEGVVKPEVTSIQEYQMVHHVAALTLQQVDRHLVDRHLDHVLRPVDSQLEKFLTNLE